MRLVRIGAFSWVVRTDWAHEIAHFCMHRSTDRHEFIDTRSTMNRSESYWNSYESEANRFAAELLMPQQLIESLGRRVIDAYKASTTPKKCH